MSTALLILGVVGIAVIFIGTLDVARSYPPLRPWKHHRWGAHFLAMNLCLMALTGWTLFEYLIPTEMPRWLDRLVMNFVIWGIAFVVWQRAWLVRDATKHVKRKQQRRQSTTRPSRKE